MRCLPAVVIWALALAAYADERQINVLFVGNSMTWFNNMPRLVAELAGKMDPPVQVNVVRATYSCTTLAKNHTPPGSPTRKAIAGEFTSQLEAMKKELAVALTPWLRNAVKALEGRPKWDVVVIQPWGSDDKDAGKLAEYVKILQDDLAKSSPGARVIMYMDASGLMERADAKTEAAVRKKMEVYQQLVRSNGVTVAPAALTCLLINKEKPACWLKYASQPENVHPGQRGSYAVACTIFAALFDRNPTGLPVNQIEMHYKIGKDGKNHDTRTGDQKGAKLTEDVSGGEKPFTKLPDDEVKFIQSKAWEAWQEWKTFCAVK